MPLPRETGKGLAEIVMHAPTVRAADKREGCKEPAHRVYPVLHGGKRRRAAGGAERPQGRARRSRARRGGTERDRPPPSVILPPGPSSADPLAAPQAPIQHLGPLLELPAFVRNMYAGF